MEKISAFLPALFLLFISSVSPAVDFPGAAISGRSARPPAVLLAQNLSDEYSEAIIWYRQRAERGEADGQYYLGLMYALGKGLPRDYQKAAMWFRKATKQGHADAQFDLGRLYAVGDGVEQDLVEAYVLISLAAGQGHKKAIKTREFMAMQMSPQQLQEAQELLRRLQQGN